MHVEIETFETPALAAIVEEGLLAHVDLSKLSDPEILALPRFTREQAEWIASRFRAKILNPYAHTELSRGLALFIATEGTIVVDVSSGIPGTPASPARASWLHQLLWRD